MEAKKPDEGKRKVEVRGHEFEVNDEFAKSWAALKMYRKFNDDDLDVMDKLDLSFELIRLSTGCGEDAIVELAGGEMAPATEIVNLAAEIVQAINPKN